MAVSNAKLQKYIKLQQAIKEAEAQLAEIKDEILTQYAGEVGTIDRGSLQIKLTPTTRLDPDKFVTTFSSSERPEFYKQVPDSSAIPKALKEQYGKTTISVSVKEIAE